MPRKVYKARKKARYISEYQQLKEDFKKEFNFSMGPRLIYTVYRKAILGYLKLDISKEESTRPEIYNNCIHEDAIWLFDYLKPYIGELKFSLSQKRVLNSIYFFTMFMADFKKSERIDNSRYINLLSNIVTLNHNQRPEGLEHHSNIKVQDPYSMVNAIKDYDLLSYLPKWNIDNNKRNWLRDFITKEFELLDSFLRLQKHAINDKSEACSVVVGGEKIQVYEKYVFDLYLSLKKDVFTIYEPFYTFMNIIEEKNKILFIDYFKRFLQAWLKNGNFFYKDVFASYNDWFPISYREYSNEEESINTKQIIIAMYESLVFALPNEINDLKRYSTSNGQHLAPHLTIDPDTNRSYVSVDIYHLIRDEVEKFLKEII